MRRFGVSDIKIESLGRSGVTIEKTLLTYPSISCIVIFPSKALHGTQVNQSNKQRISISGDVVCVAKDSELLENMMPPLEKWDKM